jgi:hypothetical protein
VRLRAWLPFRAFVVVSVDCCSMVARVAFAWLALVAAADGRKVSAHANMPICYYHMLMPGDGLNGRVLDIYHQAA